MVDLKKMHKEVTKIEKDAKDSNADLDKLGVANYVIGFLWSELERTRKELAIEKKRKSVYAPAKSYIK